MGPTKSQNAWQIVGIWVVGWTVAGLTFATISYGAGIIVNNRDFSWFDSLRLNFSQFYLWGVFSLPILWLSRRFPIEISPAPLRNVFLHFCALVLISGVHQIVHLTVFWSISPRSRQRFPSLGAWYHACFGFGFYIDLIIAILIAIAAHTLLYYRRFRVSERQQSELKAQLAQAQLRALKMQLHPHFLFNTLHSISSLVQEDPLKANQMIARLGDFLRLTIDNSEQQLVSLKEEIEFLRCYLEIEQVRFGDRLSVDFQMEPATLAAQVPHLILQPVVENAIQHAIAPRAAPGHVSIRSQRADGSLHLEVRDSGPGETASAVSRKAGIGLSNVRARLYQTYGVDFSLQTSNNPDGGFRVTMRIPFRLETQGDLTVKRDSNDDR